MKTNLNRTIKTEEDARNFLYELWENGEEFHPEDDAHTVVWGEDVTELPSYEECEKLNELMGAIYMLSAGDHANPIFDPCQYLLDLDEEEERRIKQARPTEY